MTKRTWAHFLALLFTFGCYREMPPESPQTRAAEADWAQARAAATAASAEWRRAAEAARAAELEFRKATEARDEPLAVEIEPRARLLSRAFLKRGQHAIENFAYYSYLLFSDRAEGSLDARLAAAKAYLTLHADIRDAPDGVPWSQVAIMYAPTLPVELEWSNHPSEAARQLVQNYDYDRARLMHGMLLSALPGTARRAFPRVALVGYHVDPFSGKDPIDAKQLYVIDLDLEDQDAIERRLLAFRDHVEKGTDPRPNAPEILRRAKEYFEHLGNVLLSLDALTKPEQTLNQ